MEVRELDKKDILEGLEKYHTLRSKLQNRHRWMTVLFFIGLVLLYLYLRLFNTGVFLYDKEMGSIEIRYSTAWVVNCPGDIFHSEEEDKVVYLWDYKKYPYMRVLNVGEGITYIDASFVEEVDEGSLFQLQTLRLPSTLRYIGDASFYNCTSLKTVIWEEAAENAVIGDRAFSNTGIEEMNIPKGVGEIEYGAFADNDALARVMLPDSLENIESEVFKNCINLEEVIWSASLTEIPYKTFLGCKKLAALNNTGSIRSITYNALTGTQISSEQLPENVYCYRKDKEEDIPNVEKNPWLKGYSYIYDAQKEIEYLAQLYDIPIEAFQIGLDSEKYWLNGKYYSLDMTLEEFMENDEWEMRNIYSHDDSTYSCYLETQGGECEVNLILNEEEQIVGYYFEGEECQVVLPGGVNNFGMLPDRIPYLYGKEACSEYQLAYHNALVQAEYGRNGVNHCNIHIMLENDTEE